MNLRLNNSKAILAITLAIFLLAAGILFVNNSGITGLAVSKNANPKIVLAWSRFGLAFAPIVIAKEKGFWADAGLDVEVVPFTTGKDALDSVITGKADASTNADTPIVFAAFRNEKIVIVSSVAKTKSWVVANKDSGITTEADLSGKKLATRLGTTGEYFLYNFLKTYGIKPSEVTIQPLDLALAPIALSKKDVDAIFYWQSIPYYATKVLGEKAVVFKPKFPNEVLFIVFSRDYAEKHPDNVRKFLDGLEKAMAFIRTNEEEAIEINAKVQNIPKEDLREIWRDFDFELSLRQSGMDYLRTEAKWAVDAGKIASNSTLPNFCKFIYSKPLEQMLPERVSLTC